MKNYRQLIVSFILVITTLNVYSQKFVWETDFDYRFDNREYKGMENVEDRTIFGARLTPRAGIAWGRGNSLIVGVDIMSDFGQKSFYTDPQLTVYYSYSDIRHQVYAGVFPRNKMIGEYSNAMFSDSTRFYDNNLDGLLFQYETSKGYVEAGCDWNSMYSEGQREKFLLFSSGRYNYKALYGGYAFTLYHYAGSPTERGVVDNGLFYPHLGVDFSNRWGFGRLYLQAGAMLAYQNDRRNQESHYTAGGAMVEARIERWNFGVYNTLYAGGSLMPYYKTYGDGLYMGDTFYRTESGIYNRLELYYTILSRKDIKARVGSIHHFDGDNWGWQQTLTLLVTISDKTFRKKK